MKVLEFDRPLESAHGRPVRRAIFASRSSLPVSASSLVANSVREALAAIFAEPVSLRLIEPVIPDAAAWEAICKGAYLFGVRGPLCDAAFVVREADALALASAAFGELPSALRKLSPLEAEVLAGGVRALSSCLQCVCGRELSPVERILDIRGYTTYFELLVERPAELRLGIALSREPAPKSAALLCPQTLLDVEMELAVEFAGGTIEAAELLALRPGVNVPMKTRMGELGILRLAGSALAQGECGELGGRSALIVSRCARTLSKDSE